MAVGGLRVTHPLEGLLIASGFRNLLVAAGDARTADSRFGRVISRGTNSVLEGAKDAGRIRAGRAASELRHFDYFASDLWPENLPIRVFCSSFAGLSRDTGLSVGVPSWFARFWRASGEAPRPGPPLIAFEFIV